MTTTTINTFRDHTVRGRATAASGTRVHLIAYSERITPYPHGAQVRQLHTLCGIDLPARPNPRQTTPQTCARCFSARNL